MDQKITKTITGSIESVTPGRMTDWGQTYDVIIDGQKMSTFDATYLTIIGQYGTYTYVEKTKPNLRGGGYRIYCTLNNLSKSSQDKPQQPHTPGFAPALGTSEELKKINETLEKILAAILYGPEQEPDDIGHIN